jgi:CheY-like chemotaxis protein
VIPTVAPPRVLVVDDDETERDLVAMFLRTAGLAVLTASDGDEALRLARAAPFDAAVIDVVMPGIDGWETCRQLTQMFGAETVPVVIMTGLPASQALARSFDEGAVAHVCKPVRRSVLVSTLRQYV